MQGGIIKERSCSEKEGKKRQENALRVLERRDGLKSESGVEPPWLSVHADAAMQRAEAAAGDALRDPLAAQTSSIRVFAVGAFVRGRPPPSMTYHASKVG